MPDRVSDIEAFSYDVEDAIARLRTALGRLTFGDMAVLNTGRAVRASSLLEVLSAFTDPELERMLVVTETDWPPEGVTIVPVDANGNPTSVGQRID